MTSAPTIVLDSSALIKLERATALDAILAGLVADLRLGRVRIAIPAPVITEVWRGSPAQAPLARFLKLPGITVDATDLDRARRAGESLRGTQAVRKGVKRPGAIDALVVECAQRWAAVAIVTGDTGDIAALGAPARIIEL
ncbi:MAG: type II toxin-antitoxin system VapC family toxin [Mycobacteriales bacterium]